MSDFVYRGRVAFHETDAAGIVHFAQYFRYAEVAEASALDALALLAPAMTAGQILPRVHVEADYRAPLRFWEEYAVLPRISKVGSSSLHWVFEVQSEGKLCATISWVTARRDAQGQTLPYNAEELELLAPLML